MIQRSLNDVQKFASQRLGFKVRISESFKICDFRPTIGFLFPELIKGYEFWGYGDIDVIYGNLRAFLTKSILANFDIVSFRPEYLTGCFTLFRNSKKMNTLFMQSRDYRNVLATTQYHNFDECNFMFGPLHVGADITEAPGTIESMTHLVKRKHREGYIKAYFDFNLIEGPTGRIKWTNGKIVYNNAFEAALYHFLKFKNVCRNTSFSPRGKETFFISEKTIYRKS